MLDTNLRRLARAIDARPRGIAIVCMGLAVLAGILVSRIPVTTDLLDVMPEGAPSIVAFTDFHRDFALTDGLVIVVEAEETSGDALLATIETLGGQLSASPFVASVDYNILRSGLRFAAEHFPVFLDGQAIALLAERLSPGGIRSQIRKDKDLLLSPLASPLETEAIRLDPLNIRGLVRDSLLRHFPARGLDFSTGYYLDRSHRLGILIVRPRGSVRDLAFVRALHGEVSRLAAQATHATGDAQGIRIELAGGYARAAEAVSVIWRDILVSFSASFLLVLLILYWAFRPSVLVLGIFVTTLCAALAWTLLLAYLLYGTLNIITSIVAAMLIGLFVDYMIHTYRRFEECYRALGSPLQALEITLAGTGKAILSSALTTALSFFSIVVTSFRGLHELGVVAGFGIFFSLVATLVLMASLLVWLAQSRPARLSTDRPADVGATWAVRLVDRKGRMLVAGFLVLLALGIVGAARVRFDASLEAVGLRESAAQAVEARIGRALGRQGEPLFVVARAAGEEQLTRDFDLLERQGERWRAEGRVGSLSSPGMLLPPPSLQREALARLSSEGLAGRFTGPTLTRQIREEMSRQGLVPEASLESYAAGIAGALAARDVVSLASLSQAKDPRISAHFNPGRRAMAAHLTSPGQRWDRAEVSALEEDVRRLGPDFTLVGPAMFLDEIRRTILWEVGIAVLLSLIANLSILWLHFRSWRRVWLVMIPVITGTILTMGTMGALGMRFNFFNVAAIPLVFGFGVDYGIYLMQAHLERGSEHGTDAVRAVGDRVVLCAATTIASCGSLITTHYRGLASIGAVLSLGALFCLLAALLFLPAILVPSAQAGRRP